ncbi:MAG: hypothetical protein U9Q03_05485 [Patescibacteria group bacterium]|nr:hypothetical protein [Patescibacteria group bacterium]
MSKKFVVIVGLASFLLGMIMFWIGGQLKEKNEVLPNQEDVPPAISENLEQKGVRVIRPYDDEYDAAHSLFITQTPIIVDDAPVGHRVRFEGVLDQTILFTHDTQNSLSVSDAIEEDAVHVQGFYWAGLDDQLHYVLKDNSVQIQRVLTPEFGDARDAEVLMQFSLPQGTTILFADVN